MNKNYVKELASIFGLEVGEEFMVRHNDYPEYYRYRLRFDEENLLSYYSLKCSKWSECYMSPLESMILGEVDIIKSILTLEEREYLENFLYPFKDNVCYIKKKITPLMDYNHNLLVRLLFEDKQWCIDVPPTEKNTMLKFDGMCIDKAYSLQELGLFEKEENENE